MVGWTEEINKAFIGAQIARCDRDSGRVITITNCTGSLTLQFWLCSSPVGLASEERLRL